MPNVNVHFLPRLVAPDQLAGATCVVIDVLRATTTIACALEQGAAAVLPCLEVADALEAAAALPEGTFLMGGERGGRRIDGFDLGNSPAEYAASKVASKMIIFTTTNGTRALLRCLPARRILCGAFVNLSAVCKAIEHQSNIHLICAGTDEDITREDVLLAGAIVEQVIANQASRWQLNDEAQIAVAAWQPFSKLDQNALAEHLSESRGGRNLVELGMRADIFTAAHTDRVLLVPEFAAGKITPHVSAK